MQAAERSITKNATLSNHWQANLCWPRSVANLLKDTFTLPWELAGLVQSPGISWAKMGGRAAAIFVPSCLPLCIPSPSPIQETLTLTYYLAT